MIGLDTNVLIRYLAQDDPIQSPIATELIERRLSEEEPGFVCVVVIAEIVWVLERAYRLPSQEIAAAVEALLQTNVLIVENEQEVFAAMVALKEGRDSFADALIGALGTTAGCSRTVSFDQRAQRLEGFELLL